MNDFYQDSGSPGTSSQGSSATMRAEFAAIEAGFDKLPTLTGNGGKAVVINAGGTAMSVTAAALALAVAFTTTGAGAITLTSAGATNVTLPTTGTLATLAGSESLSNKTLVSPVITTSPTAAGATWTSLGTVTTADINGGTIDGTVIGGASAAAGSFTTGGYSGAVTLGGAITYGGVALSNSVTGTGSMVLSASPTFTGTVSAAAITASSTLTLSGTAANIATGSNFISNGGTDAGLSFDSGNDATLSGALGVAGVLTVGGNAVAATRSISINSAAGQLRDIAFQSGGVGRWVLRTTNTAESGANAGSDFQILSRDDAGGSIGSALAITRSTMAATFAGTVTGQSFIPTATTTNGLGLVGANNPGLYASSTKVIDWTSGAATVTGTWSVSGASTLTGTLGLGTTPDPSIGARMRYSLTTAATQYGFFIDPINSTAATTGFQGVTIALRTTNAVFTTTTVNSLGIGDPSKGASHTITNNDAIQINDQTAGSTRNSAIRMAVTAGAGKYNVNAFGTAMNILAGNTRVGGTTDASVALDVTGEALISSTLGVSSTITAGYNATGSGTIQVGPNTPSANGSGNIYFKNSSTVRNWAIRTNQNVAGAIEIIPSTAAGGTTWSSTAAVLIRENSNVELAGDLAVNGGDLTTSATTLNLFNATATTVNFAGGASTALNIGHASGTVTVASKKAGVGATVSAYDTTNYAGFDVGNTASVMGAVYGGGVDAFFLGNAYYDGAWKYKVTGAAAAFESNTAGAYIKIASSGTAGDAITWTNAAWFATGGSTTLFSGLVVAGAISGATTVGASGAVTALNATAIPAGGTAGSGYKFSSTANFGTFFGSGAPSLSAAKGSLYLRSDGSGTANRAYINTDGGTTWTALTTAA